MMTSILDGAIRGSESLPYRCRAGYRLICAGTVEEKDPGHVMHGREAELARAMLEGGGATQQLRFNERDVAELLVPS